jgi:hypothetical protein
MLSLVLEPQSRPQPSCWPFMADLGRASIGITKPIEKTYGNSGRLLGVSLVGAINYFLCHGSAHICGFPAAWRRCCFAVAAGLLFIEPPKGVASTSARSQSSQRDRVITGVFMHWRPWEARSEACRRISIMLGQKHGRKAVVINVAWLSGC